MTDTQPKPRLVLKEDNEKKLAEARKRVKERLKAEKQAAKEQKAREKAGLSQPTGGSNNSKDKFLVDLSEDLILLDDTSSADNSVTSHDIPNLYDGTGVDPSETGIVLINTEKIPVLQYIEDGEDDIYYGDENDTHYGVPAETEPHLTLLQGFLENANNWKDKIDKVLEGWEMPTIVIEEVGFFERDDYIAVVGHVKKTDELIDGHERLTLLPHIQEFSEYLPHITLVYLKKGVSTNKWVKPLAKKYNGQKVAIKGLNYGDKPAKKVKKKNSLKSNTEHNALFPVVEATHSHDCSEHDTDINSTLEKAKNALNPDIQKAVVLQESDLYTSTQGLEAEIANAFILAVRNGDYVTAENVLSEAQQDEFSTKMKLMLAAFFLVLMPIYGKQLLDSRTIEYNAQGIFAMTEDIEQYIEESAQKAATSHVNTVIKDLVKVTKEAEGKAINESLTKLVREKVEAREPKYLKKLPVNPNTEDIAKAVKEGAFNGDKGLYKRARELAREGEGLEGIARAIRNEYQNISDKRAKTIARHETNRVFNMAQYQADVQFLTENNLMDRAYKVLRNRADDPCPICAKLVEETKANPIPFEKNFLSVGDTLTTTYKKENGKPAVQKMTVTYEDIKAGNVHVNCRCEYVLVIKQDDGTFLNNLDFRVDNSKGYNPYRDSKGRFASGASGLSSSAKNEINDLIIENYGKTKKERAKTFEQAREIAGIKNDKPVEVDSYSEGSTIVYRGVNDLKDSVSLTSKKDWGDNTYTEGDSGLYLTKSKELATAYGKNTVELGVKKSAKLLDSSSDKRQSIIDKATSKYTSDADFSKKVAVADTLGRDTGLVAILGGYDGYTRGSGDSSEIIIVNRNVLESKKKESNALEADENGYNPYRDSEGKFASGPSGGSSVSGDVKKTAKSYAEGWNYDVSKTLRAKDAETSQTYLENSSDSTKEKVRLLDEATSSQSLKKDTVLYRGVVDRSSWNSSKKFEGIQEGSEITDYGFSSTSLDKSVAKKFGEVGVKPSADSYDSRSYKDNPDLTRYVFAIKAPKGSRGLAVSEVLGKKGEQEWLLPRGSKIKVTEINAKTEYTEVKADLIGVNNV